MDSCAIDQIFAEQFGTSEEEKAFLKELMASARDGHLCLHRKIPVKGRFIEDVDARHNWCAALVARWGDLYYLQKNWVLESHIAQALKRILERDVKQLDFEAPEHLNRQQRLAFQAAFHSGLMCLCGGPGTGKTYILEAIVKHYLEVQEGPVVLAAPTGKAVGRVKQQVSVNVSQSGTLHALLKIKQGGDAFSSQVSFKKGLLIVDECSMIDVKMWAALLRAVQGQMRLILVGDDHQLPPVEAGTIFGDICSFLDGKPERIHLDECMRVERKEMVEAAERVREGHFPNVEIKESLEIEEWATHFPKPFLGQPNLRKLFKELKQFRVLSSLRQGHWGIENLNEKIFACLQKGFVSGGVWPVPILVTKTDYKRDIFNGDSGILIKTSKMPFLEKEDIVFFERGESFYSFPALLLLGFEMAYALSVHKSQGSEYDRVVLIVPKGAEKLGKEVLYTGMTRARKEIDIVGEKEVISSLLKHSGKKLSGISRRLA